MGLRQRIDSLIKVVWPVPGLREWLRGLLPCFFLDTSSLSHLSYLSQRASALRSGSEPILTELQNCSTNQFTPNIATFGISSWSSAFYAIGPSMRPRQSLFEGNF